MRIKKLFGALMTVALMSSCSNNTVEDSEKEKLNQPIKKVSEKGIVNGSETYLIFSKDRKDSSELAIDFAYFSVDESGGSDATFKDSVNQVIADFVDAVSNMSEERTRKSFSVDIFKESLPLFSSFYEEMVDEYKNENARLWQIESEIIINDSFPDFVQLTTASWSYTGGAHGNGFVVYTMVSKEDGREMKLKDYYRNVPKINELAALVLKREQGLSAGESLTEKGFWIENESNFLNENFYFDNGDLCFHFNPYEIASYADGPIEIRIPKKELNELLK